MSARAHETTNDETFRALLAAAARKGDDAQARAAAQFCDVLAQTHDAAAGASSPLVAACRYVGAARRR
jgi:hypothetical protein